MKEKLETETETETKKTNEDKCLNSYYQPEGNHDWFPLLTDTGFPLGE